jgi:hypothetical protein
MYTGDFTSEKLEGWGGGCMLWNIGYLVCTVRNNKQKGDTVFSGIGRLEIGRQEKGADNSKNVIINTGYGFFNQKCTTFYSVLCVFTQKNALYQKIIFL